MSAALVQFQPRFVWWQAVCEGDTNRFRHSFFFSTITLMLYPWVEPYLHDRFSIQGGDRLRYTTLLILGTMFAGFVVGYCIVTLISVIGKWQNYNKTVYRLHPDRIAISEGFLTHQEKELRFSAATEVSLRRSVFQRLAGLGSVYVATVATGQGEWPTVSLVGASSVMASGVLLRDIPKPDVVYDTVRALMERSRPA